MSYKHLSFEARIVINNMKNLDYSLTKIADNIGVHKSTISRELKRNCTKWYRPLEAQQMYLDRRNRENICKLSKESELKKYVTNGLNAKDSPEQIAGRIQLEYPENIDMRISHESIYKWIYQDAQNGGDIFMNLRRSIKKRQRRLNKKSRRMTIPDRKSIHKRPLEVENRMTSGHWEGDTIVGKGYSGYITTMVDRSNQYLAAAIMKDKKPSSLNISTIEAFGEISNDSIKTITLDNGTEFCEYKYLEEMFECSIYFADPYSSWQRGTNENMNGLIRQYFPKKMDFSEITQNDVDEVVKILNNRPRKSLGYRTPHEVANNLPVAPRF